MTLRQTVLNTALVLSVFSPAFSSTAAQAATPGPVAKAAEKMKTADVRTVIKASREDSPCELGYDVDLQVKQASYNPATSQMSYSWVTVKTITVSKSGETMEVCAE